MNYEVGDIVRYCPRPGVFETGTVTRVGQVLVHVRYGRDTTSKATNPRDLVLVKKGK